MRKIKFIHIDLFNNTTAIPYISSYTERLCVDVYKSSNLEGDISRRKQIFLRKLEGFLNKTPQIKYLEIRGNYEGERLTFKNIDSLTLRSFDPRYINNTFNLRKLIVDSFRFNIFHFTHLKELVIYDEHHRGIKVFHSEKIHNHLLELCLVFPHLPAYIILEIFDYLPYMRVFSHLFKIRTIEKVKISLRNIIWK